MKHKYRILFNYDWWLNKINGSIPIVPKVPMPYSLPLHASSTLYYIPFSKKQSVAWLSPVQEPGNLPRMRWL